MHIVFRASIRKLVITIIIHLFNIMHLVIYEQKQGIHLGGLLYGIYNKITPLIINSNLWLIITFVLDDKVLCLTFSESLAKKLTTIRLLPSPTIPWRDKPQILFFLICNFVFLKVLRRGLKRQRIPFEW